MSIFIVSMCLGIIGVVSTDICTTTIYNFQLRSLPYTTCSHNKTSLTTTASCNHM
jgi:hypothetical protein